MAWGSLLLMLLGVGPASLPDKAGGFQSLECPHIFKNVRDGVCSPHLLTGVVSQDTCPPELREAAVRGLVMGARD